MTVFLSYAVEPAFHIGLDLSSQIAPENGMHILDKPISQG